MGSTCRDITCKKLEESDTCPYTQTFCSSRHHFARVRLRVPNGSVAHNAPLGAAANSISSPLWIARDKHYLKVILPHRVLDQLDHIWATLDASVPDGDKFLVCPLWLVFK